MSNDTLNGTAANDTLNGGSGNTTAYGFGGNDSLSGNGGNDTLFGDGTLSGEASGSASVGTTGTLTTSNFGQYWGGVSLTALHQDGTASTVAINAKGIGVAGDVNGNASANAELGYDAVHGTSEKLKVDFNGHSVTQATVGFSAFFSGEQTYREAGAWTAFKDGVQVSNGTFIASSTAGTGSVTIQPGVSFDSLVFTALPYVNAQGNPVAGNTGDTSEYYIRTIDYCWEPGADTVTSGQDSLYGGSGNDMLYGGLDNDQAYGGDSNDTVQGDAGNDVIYGDAGDDVLYGDGASEANSDGSDSVYGGVGNDTIYGGGGNDYLDGGDGSNTYYGGSGDDTIVGGSGNETIYGGSGNDLISGNGGAGVIYGEDGNDTIVGGSTNDTLDGGAGNDSITGGGGSDQMYGGDGNDTIVGGSTNDTLDGGAGDDVLNGGGGADQVFGRDGNDTGIFVGGEGAGDVYDGGKGTDTIQIKLTAAQYANTAIFNDLKAYYTFLSNNSNPNVDNGPSFTFNSLNMSAKNWEKAELYVDGVLTPFPGSVPPPALFTTGNDTVNFNGLSAASYLAGTQYNGLAGNDSVTLANDTGAATTAGYDTAQGFHGGDGNDTIVGGALIDKIFGDAGNDSIAGNDGSDILTGGAGADSVTGGNGEDLIYGDDTVEGANDGADSLYGGVGNDTIYGGGGNDYLDGGDGSNTYYGGSGDDTIVGGSGNETIYGGSGNDLISGNGGAGVIYGEDGNDTIVGGSTNDTLDGGAGNDSITGGGGSDQMYGGDGNDTIVGGSTNDTVDGGAGDDVLNGGGGADQVFGRDGNDTGIFVGGEGAGDVYDGGKGTDTIQIKLTAAQFNNAAIHGDLVSFVQFLSANSNPATDSGPSFTFNSLNLSAKNWENVEVYVDGVLTPVTQPLFTENGDTVNFNGVAVGSYTAGTQYNALGGNDTVTLANNGAAAAAAGFDATHDFHAGAGNDTVSGGGLNDSVFGDSGNDSLTGGAGDDVLHGDDGSNGTEVTSAVSAVDGLYDVAGASSLHLTIQNMGDVSVGYRNMFGGYAQDANGNPVGGQILFASTFDTASHTVTLDISNLDNVAKIGFFIIPNGHALNPAITDNADVQFQQVSGKWTAFVNGQPLAGEGQPIFFSNPALNADGAYDHETDNGQPGNSNWEDLAGGGDRDNNDVNMQIDVTKTVGSGGNDSVHGGDGNDSVYGDGGNDTLDGGAGSDAVYGGIGNDAGLYTAGQGGTDVYDGGTGTDTMVISLTAAQFANPAVVAELAQFNLFLQANSNPATASGPSFVFHSLGDLTVSNWENGLLLVDGQQTALPVLPPLFTTNNDSVDFNNVVAGTYLPGTQYAALDGNDTVVLANSPAAATAAGYDAAQAFHANGGNDTVTGGGLNDTIFGDAGNDALSGGAGSDELYGGDGNDALYYNADGTWNAGALNSGNGPGFPGSGATTTINGLNASADLFAGGAGTDTLYGTSGNDAIFLEDPYHTPTGAPHISGVEVIDAGAGNDIVDLTSTVYGYGDVTILGGDGNDTLWASAGNDSIDGGAGDDSVDGGFGNDSIDGGSGNDTLLGGAGDDTISGGDGNDVLAGGAGNDQLSGGTGHDNISGGDGNDVIDGATGDDTLAGDAGDDTVTGGDGNDTISGGDGNDTLAGDAGTDSVVGGLGSDSIDGGSGNDTLIGDGVPGNGGGAHIAVSVPDANIDPNTIVSQWAAQGVHLSALNYDAGSGSYTAASFGTKFIGFDIDGSNTSDVSLQGHYQYSGIAVAGGIDGGEVDTGDGSSVNGGEVLRLTFDQPMANLSVQLSLLFDGETTQSADHGPFDSGYMEVAQWTAYGANGETLTGSVQGSVNGLVDIDLAPGFAIVKLELTPLDDGAGNSGNNSDFMLRSVSGDTYGAANDTINGGEGDDVIQGNQGDDQLFGDAGNDSIDGGTGNDLIYGDSTVSTPTTFTVGQGADGTYSLANAQGAELTGEYLGGSAGYNNSYGYYLADAAGHPVAGGIIFANVHATGGAFSIDLNAAQVSGAASIGFFIIPNGGSDNPGLADGADITFHQVSGAWTPFLNGSPLGGEGAATLFSNPVLNVDGIDHEVDNSEAGNSNWEDLVGGGDRDFNDVNVQIVVTGSAGGGNDSLLGNDGSDTIHGGGGNDTMDGGAGSDIVLGETGDDVGVFHAGQGGTDSYDGGFGTDTIQIHVTGAQYADFAVLQELADYHVFLANNSNPNTDSGPTFTFSTLGLSATDWENGELYVDGVLTAWPVIPPLFTPTDDNVDFNSVVAGTYRPGTQYDGLAGNDHVVLPDNHTEASEAGFVPGTGFHGGDGNDTIVGGGLDDTIYGDAGDDALYGAAGEDQLFGGDGNDKLYWAIDQLCPTDIAYYTSAADCAPIQLLGVQLGGLGLSFDVYVGGAGTDTLFGTNGDDAIVLDVPALPPPDTQRIQGVEVIDAGDGNDLIDLSSNIWHLGDTTLLGGNGFDTIWASTGNDFVDGGTGNDFLVGNLGDDTVVGSAGNDLIYGGHGNDSLVGDGVSATATSVTSPIAQTPDGLYAVNGADSVTIALENKGNASAAYHNSYGYYFADASGNPVSGVVVWDDQHATAGATYNATFTSAQLAGVSFIGAFIIPDGNSLNASLSSNTPVTFQQVSGQWTAFVGSTALVGQGLPVLLGDSTHNPAGYDYEHDSSLPGNSNWEDLAGGGDNDYNDVNIQIDLTKTVLVPDSYNDTINGDCGDDTISGEQGSDVLFGGAGNDLEYGGDGWDSLNGDDGNDILYGGAGGDCVHGDAGDDTMYGDAGNDSIEGGDGNDLAFGGDGNDELYGGGGTDTLYGDAGNDYVAGGAEGDYLYGGSGDDSIYGAEGGDSLDGGDGNDTLVGDAGNDTIVGGSGNDGIYGGEGDDSILAGDGDDYVEAGAGNDAVLGGAGADTIYGGEGDDSLNGGDGNDLVYGGNGDDLVFGGGTGADTLFGDAGNDYVAGGTENDQLYGGTGDDSVYGAEGDDFIDGGDGSDTLLGDDGNDTIAGGEGDDGIYGGTGDDSLYGGDGNDYVEGNGGADTIFGDAGNDTLLGGEGNDVVVGGAGNDSIDGGEGSDLLVGNDGDDTVLGDSGDDYIYGQDGNDVLVGGSGDDTVEAGSGNDSSYGGDGNDLLYGGTGDDSIEGNDGNDRAYGGVGNDMISGGAGYDLLIGEAGNDSIDGGADDDLIYGDDTSSTVLTPGGGLYALNGAGSAHLDIQYLSSDAGFNSSYGYYLADASGTPIGGEVIWANVKSTGGHFTLDLNAAALAGAAFIGTFIIPDGANANPSLVDGQAVTFAQNGGGQWQAFVGASPLGGAGLPAFFSDVSKNADAFDHQTDGPVAGNSNWEDIAGGGDHDFNDVNLNVTVSTEAAGNDTILGGDGQDTVFGNAGDDSIDGGNGNDELYGNAGDDTVLGGAGNDIVYGDGGNDVLFGGDGVDVVVGGDGADIMSGDAGDDYMYGQVGNDVMFGGDGADYMEGGEGADSIYGGAGNDFMYGGVGNDEVYGGDGQDTLYGEAGNDLLYGGAGGDVLVGAEGSDSLYGDDGDDYLFGQVGDDALFGGAGDDYIEGGAGNDTVDGGDGNDLLHGGEGDDVLTGGAGNDTLYTDGGNDWVFGGDGNDVLVGGDGSDSMYGDAGDDQIYALNGNDVIFGGAGSDYIEAGAGNDTIRGGADNGLFHLNVVPGGNILVNGSFEDVVDGPVQGTWAPVPNADVAGWDNTGGSSIEIWNTPFNQALATDGAHLAETDWDVQLDDYSQTVDAATGVHYTLSFDFASRTETAGIGNTTDSFEIWWNGAKVGTFDPDSTDWYHASVDVVGAAGNDVLEIREAGANDTYGALIDNMSLVGPGSQSMTLSGGDTVYGGSGADAFQYSTGDGVDTIQDYSKAEGDHIDLALATGISFQTLVQGNDAFIVFSDAHGVLENQAIRIVGCTNPADLDIHLI